MKLRPPPPSDGARIEVAPERGSFNVAPVGVEQRRFRSWGDNARAGPGIAAGSAISFSGGLVARPAESQAARALAFQSCNALPSSIRQPSVWKNRHLHESFPLKFATLS